MTARPVAVSALDVALLGRIGAAANVVVAARALGISRDRANYRLRRLARAFGGPVVRADRGGARHGTTVLTPLGDRIAHGGFDVVETLGPLPRGDDANRLRGTYRAGPPPEVELGPSLALRVAFRAADGEQVGVALDPESIVVARARFPSSARNVLPAVVEAVTAGGGPFGRLLFVRAGGQRLRVSVTAEPIRTLGLAPGRRVFLYVKATAIRRIAAARAVSRGSPRS